MTFTPIANENERKSMHIRKAKTDDIQTLQEIAKRVIRNNYTSFLGQDNVAYFIDSGQSDKEIEDGIKSCFVMRQNETIIGYAVVRNDLLHLIMIDVPYQHKGYGVEFLAFIEQKMFDTYSEIKLQTFEKNIDTIRFYEKNGWAIKSVEHIEEMDMNMLHMVKAKGTNEYRSRSGAHHDRAGR
jgi:GNAT superfamily N-acetyltransferase